MYIILSLKPSRLNIKDQRFGSVALITYDPFEELCIVTNCVDIINEAYVGTMMTYFFVSP